MTGRRPRPGHFIDRPGEQCAHCGQAIVKRGRFAGKAGVVHERCWQDWLTTSAVASTRKNWKE